MMVLIDALLDEGTVTRASDRTALHAAFDLPKVMASPHT